jgi:MoaA/NifB/PqqE/SkfB family radical SAM enzyme
MTLQFEITTRCNFDCFYCAGRHMRQGDMAYETFVSLLERDIAAHGIPEVVSLQGEGEPTLHHDFLRMAEFVQEKGSRPYTITNGTYKHPERLIGLFPRIGVSVDTLDEVEGEKIGRHNLPRVLAFVDALASAGVEVVIHSVAHKAHTPPIAKWCKERGFRHVIQPLQTKPDYSRYYPRPPRSMEPVGRFSCRYLSRPRMRYYTLEGLEMPCCFIKDTTAYEGMSSMLHHQEAGTWPKCCIGCRYALSVRNR